MNKYEKSLLELKNQQDYVKNLQRKQQLDPTKGIQNATYPWLDRNKVKVSQGSLNSR